MSVFPSVGYNYRISGAMVAGPSHMVDGISCEDAWDAKVFGNVGAAVVVADGLGSAEHAKDGSDVAVSAAITAISTFFDPWPDGAGCDADIEKNDRMVLAACRSAHDAVVTHAVACGISPRSFATTLIVLLWYGNTLTTARIGDGAVVGLRKDEIILLSAPQERRYVNEVVSLTDDIYEDGCAISSDVSDITACSVFTDGCERFLLEKKTQWVSPI